MGRNLDDVINSLPADRQRKIAALSQEKVEEMLAHATTLTDFRKAVGKTQVEVAMNLGINQNAVSQLEKRSDTYVSTLRRFLESLGLTLELSVISKDGVRIDLRNFSQWPANNIEALAHAGKAPGRKAAAKPAAKKAAAKPAAKKAAKPAAKKSTAKAIQA